MTLKTARQVKDLIKNLSTKSNIEHHLLLKRYMMERLLDRISVSEYKDNYILKGGMLISSLLGVEDRATKDMDATIKGLPLTAEDMEKNLREICRIDVKDNVKFEIKKISSIMIEEEHPGVRFHLKAKLDETIVPLTFDISTGDVITPGEIDYPYKTMLGEKTIPIFAYPIETVLAEKLEAVLTKGENNTRTRDFYDIHLLSKTQEINENTFPLALYKSAEKRGLLPILEKAENILTTVEKTKELKDLWIKYQKENPYARRYNWETVLHSVRKLCLKAKLNVRESSALEKPKVNLKPKTPKNTKDRELEG